MTSNLGSDVIQMLSGEENYEVMKSAVMDVVAANFRPEFINRVDETVVFHPLDKQALKGIADRQLTLLQQRLAPHDLTLSLDETLLDHILALGFDSTYGARPLKRVIRQLVENPLATALLSGEFTPGSSIKGSLDGQESIFETV
tara:strand:- start:411 stop:842 length:432 start_codon:yes stop_codon:yes gene_type:complete